MNNCLELIYDRFGIEFYPVSAVIFKKTMMEKQKFIAASDIAIDNSSVYLQVGNYPAHSEKQINANDTYDNITSKVSEKKKNEQYTVSIHFEFQKPTEDAVFTCESLDYDPYHIVLNQYDFTGAIASRRVIRNGTGQSRVEMTEEKGIIKVDMTVQNLNGIQLIG